MTSDRTIPFALVLNPVNGQFERLYDDVIRPACEVAGLLCGRVDEQMFTETMLDRTRAEIARADLIIADVSGENPNVFYEVGYAAALNKPIVVLARSPVVPSDVKRLPIITYDLVATGLNELRNEFAERLAGVMRQLTDPPALRNPAPRLQRLSRTVTTRDQLFVSYCHRDAKWLRRLQVHLRPLERDGSVKRWDDTMIDSGDEWRVNIAEAVAAAKVAVLFISADFIASEFIHTNELPPLLAAARTKGAIILPVIVSPCRFEQIKNLSQFQAVNDPTHPLINMTKTQRERLFVKLTSAIEAALAG